jgi:hypothetical protein
MLATSFLLSKNVKIKIYSTVVLLVVLYGCEIWSLTLREEHKIMFLSFVDIQLHLHYCLEVPILVSNVFFVRRFHFT